MDTYRSALSALGVASSISLDKNLLDYLTAQCAHIVPDGREDAFRRAADAHLDEALERMQAENRHLTDEQARHLTVHGVSRNEDGTYQVRRNGGPEETFQEAQVAAMTRMHKPELHTHMAQALQRQEEAKASMAEANTFKKGSSPRLPGRPFAPERRRAGTGFTGSVGYAPFVLHRGLAER